MLRSGTANMSKFLFRRGFTTKSFLNEDHPLIKKVVKCQLVPKLTVFDEDNQKLLSYYLRKNNFNKDEESLGSKKTLDSMIKWGAVNEGKVIMKNPKHHMIFYQGALFGGSVLIGLIDPTLGFSMFVPLSLTMTLTLYVYPGSKKFTYTRLMRHIEDEKRYEEAIKGFRKFEIEK